MQHIIAESSHGSFLKYYRPALTLSLSNPKVSLGTAFTFKIIFIFSKRYNRINQHDLYTCELLLTALVHLDPLIPTQSRFKTTLTSRAKTETWYFSVLQHMLECTKIKKQTYLNRRQPSATTKSFCFLHGGQDTTKK